jgi:hypothetical protein
MAATASSQRKSARFQEDSGTHGPRWDLARERLEQPARTTEVTSCGISQARLDEAPPASLPVVVRSALRRELCQLGRDGRSASQRSMLRRRFERLGNTRVGGYGTEREVSGPLFRVGDDLCQACVDLPAPLRADRGDDRGREQRVREADAVALQLDYAGANSAVERVFSYLRLGGCGRQRGRRRLGKKCGGLEH